MYSPRTAPRSPRLLTSNPPTSCAHTVHGFWGTKMKGAAKALALKAVAEETGVMEIKPADDAQQSGMGPLPTYRPALYKLIGRVYTVASCGVGVYCLLAAAGILNCGYHHTCADPSCTPSKLPFGLTSDHMPFSLNKNYPGQFGRRPCTAYPVSLPLLSITPWFAPLPGRRREPLPTEPALCDHQRLHVHVAQPRRPQVHPRH